MRSVTCCRFLMRSERSVPKTPPDARNKYHTNYDSIYYSLWSVRWLAHFSRYCVPAYSHHPDTAALCWMAFHRGGTYTHKLGFCCLIGTSYSILCESGGNNCSAMLWQCCFIYHKTPCRRCSTCLCSPNTRIYVQNLCFVSHAHGRLSRCLISI